MTKPFALYLSQLKIRNCFHCPHGETRIQIPLSDILAHAKSTKVKVMFS